LREHFARCGPISFNMLSIEQAHPLAANPFGISNASVAMLICGLATIFVINRWR
jgi:hypothetical protein